jgi:rod shape-determining protein MreB
MQSEEQDTMTTDKTGAKSKTLSVGIDLGTSRSAVSGNNGKREYVESYVGWPKDFVAAKMLGKQILFGEEALRHRLSLQLTRPLEQGVIKDGTEKNEESVTELIGHLMELAEPTAGQKIHAAVGVPAEALKVNRMAIKGAVSKFADKLIVVSEPFAVAYGLNALDNAMVIDLGAGTVDFCIMHGTMPEEEDQRSLVTAGDHVDQQLLDLLREQHPEASLTLTMVRRFKEEHGFVGEPTRQVSVRVPVKGKEISIDITQEVRRACESIMPAIAETAMDMIANFDPEFQAKVRNNIILAGGGSQIEGIDAYLAEAMQDISPCRFTRVEDPLFSGAAGALALANDMPAEYWEDL